MRETLEQAWLTLTRKTLPALAATRGWPVRADHCFQRILLDVVHGGRWYDFVAGRPAYRTMDETRLTEAVELAQAVVAGTVDLTLLNDRSLAWRRGTGAALRD